jgi:hypothetical protein
MVKVKEIVLGLLLFGIVAGLLFGAWVEMGDHYSSSWDQNYTDYFNNISSSMDSARNISDTMSKKASGEIGFFSGGGVGKLVIEAFKLPLNALKMTSTILTSTWEVMGLPAKLAWVFKTIMAIIVLYIVWALLSAFFGRTSS